MKLYLAGGLNGNLGRWFWNDDMNVSCAVNKGYIRCEIVSGISRVNLLESFYYIREWQYPMIGRCKSFMLDSGAFSFMQNTKSVTDWNAYIDRYADFVRDNGVELFFELDIDSIVGYGGVLKLRDRLERRAGKRCIPVWHKSRGTQNYIDMCKEFDYVAIGGIVSGEIKRNEYKSFNPLCDIAHNHNARVHGLGFTVSDLSGYRFDSADSTAWIYGNRGGYLYKYDGIKMTKINKPLGTKLAAREAAIHNFWEWVRYGEHLSTDIHMAGSCGRRYILEGCDNDTNL